MTTLRRKLIQKFEELIKNKTFSLAGVDLADSDSVWGTEKVAELSALLADTAIEIFNDRDVRRTSDLLSPKSDPAWALFHGETPDNSRLLFEKEAFDAFERDMQTPDNWFWFPAKTSDEKVWKYFREFVIKVYTEDRKAFEKYQTWRTQPFARGAMSNLAIKRNPENFPASWSDFLSATRSNQPSLRPVDVDDNGAPISYA